MYTVHSDSIIYIPGMTRSLKQVIDSLQEAINSDWNGGHYAQNNL